MQATGATVSTKHTARTEAPLSTAQRPTKYGSARGDEFASRRGVPQVEAASPLAQPRSAAAARPEAASSGYAAIGPSIYERLPATIKNETSNDIFERRLREFLVSKSLYSVKEYNEPTL
jgi:hypothetical protein